MGRDGNSSQAWLGFDSEGFENIAPPYLAPISQWVEQQGLSPGWLESAFAIAL